MRRAVVLVVSIALLAFMNVGIAGAKNVPTCNGMAATIVGTNGPDLLEGTSDADVIVALNGDDGVRGLEGNDVICGGNGDDFVIGNQGEDVLSGGNGHDIVIGGPDNDAVFGDNGNDLLFGNFGDDMLYGGNGQDFLNGDLPFPAVQDPAAPPGAYQDPNPNSDFCDGGNGPDASTWCESETSIEQHPDPADVVFEE